VLLVSIGLIVAAFAYFIDWSTVRRERVRVVQPKTDNVERRYAGSIIVPTGGGMCWTFILDNRSEKMRDGGFSKCDEAMRQFDKENPSQNTDTLRLHEVGKAFRHQGN
jgi:hypothetical protein